MTLSHLLQKIMSMAVLALNNLRIVVIIVQPLAPPKG
jgi:hypothetical protein